jgi:hypothetical protein
LNMSKLDQLSKPKKLKFDVSHIRRGSTLLEHRLSLPHLKPPDRSSAQLL